MISAKKFLIFSSLEFASGNITSILEAMDSMDRGDEILSQDELEQVRASIKKMKFAIKTIENRCSKQEEIRSIVDKSQSKVNKIKNGNK